LGYYTGKGFARKWPEPLGRGRQSRGRITVQKQAVKGNEDGTDSVPKRRHSKFRRRESPKRKHTIFRTGRKFEIKNKYEVF